MIKVKKLSRICNCCYGNHFDKQNSQTTFRLISFSIHTTCLQYFWEQEIWNVSKWGWMSDWIWCVRYVKMSYCFGLPWQQIWVIFKKMAIFRFFSSILITLIATPIYISISLYNNAWCVVTMVTEDNGTHCVLWKLW